MPPGKDTEVRDRIVRWDDPRVLAESGRAMDGRSFLEAMRVGELPHPPICHLVGFVFEAVGEGHVAMGFTPHESQYNPIGTVHGGAISTVLDSVMGCAVHSLLTSRRGYTTLELKVNLLRAVRVETGPMKATGRVLHLGRQTAMADGSLLDTTGKLYAQATSTCLVFDVPHKS